MDAAQVIAVVGSGAMGQGIAQVAAQAGHAVLLFDARPDGAETAVAQIGRALGTLVEKGRMTAERRTEILARLRPVASLSQLAPAALVIEAIVEDLAAKQELFRSLEQVVEPTALLASNTSSLSITAIGAALKHPERLAGLHFFNPAAIMELVEVVAGLGTDPAVLQTLADRARGWGKIAVQCRSTPGFIVNRVARPFYAEGLRVVQEGAADPATVDAIQRESGGFRMGPFELMDLIGHDVNFAVTCSVHRAYFGDPRFQPSLLQQELVEAGRLGRKSGRGFYDYHANAAVPLAATIEAGPRPKKVVIEGDLGPAAALPALLGASGIETEIRPGPGRLLVDEVTLALTDGRTATARQDGDQSLVLFDLALDYAKAGRIALAVADRADPRALSVAAGLFQALGKAVSVIDDIPGLVVMRTVAMLANEAADTVLHKVATPGDIDLAMTKGVNYPVGPLAWAEAIGLARIVTVLDALAGIYGEDRYRASALLRRKVAGGGRISQ